MRVELKVEKGARIWAWSRGRRRRTDAGSANDSELLATEKCFLTELMKEDGKLPVEHPETRCKKRPESFMREMKNLKMSVLREPSYRNINIVFNAHYL